MSKTGARWSTEQFVDYKQRRPSLFADPTAVLRPKPAPPSHDTPPLTKARKSPGKRPAGDPAGCSCSDAELEPNFGDAPVVPPQGPAFYSGRVRVRLIVIRKRPIDPCNECSKWLVDCLRYFRILEDDRLSDIALEVDQRKAGKGEAERTEILIEPLSADGRPD